MKTTHFKSQVLPALLLLAGTLLPSSALAQADVDPPKTEAIGPYTDIKVITPTNTLHGTRGLTQTGSAEALGEGRLVFGLNGSWYPQWQGPRSAAPGNPQAAAQIYTGTGSASLGVSPYIDIFTSLSIYGSKDYTPPASTSSTGSGLGTLRGGIQGTLPFAAETPVRLAAQAVLLQGLSGNQINTYQADGYNYFETRTGLDFMVKFLQTIVLGSEESAFKLHANEAIVTSTESGRDALLLLALGLQFNAPVAAFGLELNTRTSLKELDMPRDPLWITPSVQFRTPYNMNVTFGGDISLSTDRADNEPRALEPFRLFSGIVFSFDTQADKRQRIKDRERAEELEKARMQNRNRGLADSLTRSDAQRKASADSLAALTNKSKLDSAAMANKAKQDSLALAEAARNLALEKSKRSDAEKQLLSTGLLLMDAVYFETDKTVISINSKPYLNIIAKMLVKYPKLNIEVSGHTDNVGGAASNMTLSQGRAQSVRDYMVTVAPELNNHLSAKGYGLTQPKSSNATAAGRTLNRRTELQVLNKEALQEYNR